MNQQLLIVGAGDLGQAVAEWVIASGQFQRVAFLDDHPDATKAQCHRDTGIDPKTIRRWWDA